MRLVLLIVMFFGFANFKIRCNHSDTQTAGSKTMHGYLLAGYPVKNLDSTCLKNVSGSLMKNSCIISMNEYFMDVIPDLEFMNNFDSAYIMDSQFESNGGITITKFERRFTGGDISELLKDSALKRLAKESIPSPKVSTRLYFNKNAKPQSFVYRIFEFEADYINKKIKNTSQTQELIEGMTNLVHDKIKTDYLNVYFLNSFKDLREISNQFRSDNFVAIN